MTASLVQGWRAFWFPEIPLERVAIFRIAVSTFALVDVLLVSNYVIAYTQVDQVFFDPIVLLTVLPFAIPSATVFLGMTVVMAVGLTSAAVGFQARAALAVAAPLYLYHWSLFNSWGKVNHGKIPVVIALFALIVAPSAARLSVDAWRRRRAAGPLEDGPTTDAIAGWALRLVGVTIVAAYVLSVVAKLRNTGLRWAMEPILQAQLLVGDSWLHGFLVDNPGLLIVLQTLTLIVEAATVFIFLGGWVRNLLLAMLAMFHVGSYFLLETEFTGFLICYLVFFRLERMLPWLHAARHRWFGERDGHDEGARRPAVP